ncbi:MAG: rhodanese-like domain-containing protein [Woeseiaceae bacterium]|nr:rhodanese-like domain-containing protein [Woeseiaceae bacterium]
MYQDLSPAEFAKLREVDAAWQLLDVREPWEIDIVSLPDTIRIPLAEVPARVDELDAERPLAVICHSGGRSARAAGFLAANGFARVANIAGGIDAWSQELDRSLPRY